MNYSIVDKFLIEEFNTSVSREEWMEFLNACNSFLDWTDEGGNVIRRHLNRMYSFITDRIRGVPLRSQRDINSFKASFNSIKKECILMVKQDARWNEGYAYQLEKFELAYLKLGIGRSGIFKTAKELIDLYA